MDIDIPPDHDESSKPGPEYDDVTTCFLLSCRSLMRIPCPIGPLMELERTTRMGFSENQFTTSSEATNHRHLTHVAVDLRRWETKIDLPRVLQRVCKWWAGFLSFINQCTLQTQQYSEYKRKEPIIVIVIIYKYK